MTEQLKKLIETAPICNKGSFKSFLIVSNGAYDGFWGKTGFNNIMLFGQLDDVKRPFGDDIEWVKISAFADKLNIFGLNDNHVNFNLDIPEEYDVPRIWFDKPVFIDYTIPTADIMGNVGSYLYGD